MDVSGITLTLVFGTNNKDIKSDAMEKISRYLTDFSHVKNFDIVENGVKFYCDDLESTDLMGSNLAQYGSVSLVKNYKQTYFVD